MINAYHRLGHGFNVVAPWTGDVFFIAAILYVDDSDLWHLSDGIETDEELQSHPNASGI